MTVLDSGWKESWMDVVWAALEEHRETNIPEGVPEYDEQWDDICTAMAWIREELDLPDEVEKENPLWEAPQ